jgi:hypothetical protein
MTRIDEIGFEISALKKELKSLQASCTHPPLALKYLYDSFVEDLDKNEHSYLTEFHCGLCDKHWRENGACTVSKIAKQVEKRSELYNDKCYF